MPTMSDPTRPCAAASRIPPPMIRTRLSLTAALALALGLAGADAAHAAGTVAVDDDALVYVGDDAEPNNVVVELDEDAATLVVREHATRIAQAPAACTVDADRYVARCPAAGIRRIVVRTSNGGSDVRIRANLPAHLIGGAGDDVLIGGPADDVIEGGGGMDILGGGAGADELRGGPGTDLVTYVDRVARDDRLLARRAGVTVRPGARGASGARGEGDTIAPDVEQFEGGAGDDRFELRDGRAQAVACNAGRDVAILDPRDDAAIDCERAEVAPAPGGRMTTPTLMFPFPKREDRGRATVQVKPQIALRGNAIVLTVRCQPPVGLLAAEGPDCTGRVRMTRSGGTAMAQRSIRLGRGRALTWRVPLTSSLPLARRAGGLDVVVTAYPDRGAGVRRDLRFAVRG